MISQAELEGAIARYRARERGEAVPETASYPADVEVGYEGGETPIPAEYGVPRDAHRSDAEMQAYEAAQLRNQSHRNAPAIPRGNDEPTMVPGNGVPDFAAEMLDSGVVEIDGEEE